MYESCNQEKEQEIALLLFLVSSVYIVSDFSHPCRRCSCSRSAIMAMNSLLVGLPRVLWMV